LWTFPNGRIRELLTLLPASVLSRLDPGALAQADPDQLRQLPERVINSLPFGARAQVVVEQRLGTGAAGGSADDPYGG